MINIREKTWKKTRHPYLLPSKIKLRSTVYYNGLYSLTIKVNYQTNLTKIITMRVERRKTKKQGRLKSWNFRCRRKIRYVAKIPACSENLLFSTIQPPVHHYSWLKFHCFDTVHPALFI